MHDWRSLYPFESHEMLVGGHRYHYLDEGQGPVLLLVHGNPTWSFYWRQMVTALRGKYRLIVPDHIGCGLSEKPAADQYEFRLARRIEDLGQLVGRLGLEAVTLVAHDWGGAIGLGAALAQPERFARFVLLNTAAFRSRRCPWRIRVCRTPLLGRLGVQGLNLFARAAIRMAVRRHERITPAVRAGLFGALRLLAASFGDPAVRVGHPAAGEPSELCDVGPNRSGPGQVPLAASLFDLGDARLVFHA